MWLQRATQIHLRNADTRRVQNIMAVIIPPTTLIIFFSTLYSVCFKQVSVPLNILPYTPRA